MHTTLKSQQEMNDKDSDLVRLFASRELGTRRASGEGTATQLFGVEGLGGQTNTPPPPRARAVLLACVPTAPRTQASGMYFSSRTELCLSFPRANGSETSFFQMPHIPKSESLAWGPCTLLTPRSH